MILVTGATGFIGSHVVERLLAAGERVRCLVRASSNPRYLPVERVEVARGDLAGGAGLTEALRGVDVVLHLAGTTKSLDAAGYYRGNVEATANLARACRGVSRFVHVSSLAAAGPSSRSKPLDEAAEPTPVSHYGRSKLEGEMRAREALPGCVIVRPPVVYGPRDTDVFQILRAVSRGWMLGLGRGERWFSAIYVEDLAEGLLLAARSPAAEGRTYFLAHPRPVSWREFADTAAGLLGRPVRHLALPLALARAGAFAAERAARLRGRPGILSRDKIAEAACAWWTCDPGRAARELGFQAPTSLEKGLAASLAWYRRAGWL